MLKRRNILAALLSLAVLGMVSMRDVTAESPRQRGAPAAMYPLPSGIRC